MDLAEALLAQLEAAPAVTAIVADRIHWARRDQASPLPALVLTTVSRTSEGDTIEAEGPIWTSRVQADCFAGSHEEAWALAAAVRAAVADPADVAGFDLFGADVEGPTDLSEDQPEGVIHRASLDLIIRHGADT